ncbi:hypothetical protein NCS52_00504200 [Fusarium sp. LHS14.1]|nr:hypothetical protein NCS52_00504200 [Fusarium sp. LHS14.1]
MSHYNYEDDEVYNGPGCCMKCCRALDVGNHDACGACYCRRVFRPDYDRDIYPGLSLGEYYPGRRLEDWEDTSSSAMPARATNNSTNRGGRGTSSRNTSDLTSNSTRQATTTSETRQSPENGAGSKDSDKSEEKKPKRSWFAGLFSWLWS